MKKSVVLVIAAVMLSLTACSGGLSGLDLNVGDLMKSSQTEDTAEAVETEPAETKAPETEAPTEPEIKVAVAEATEEFDEGKFMVSCREINYDTLMHFERDNQGAAIRFVMDVKDIAEDQLLGTDMDGNSYLVFDERPDPFLHILKGDRVVVYGIFDGIVSASGVELPKVRAKAMYFPEEYDETEALPEEYETYYVINCQQSITLREEPNTKAKEIRQIPLGAAVSFVETAENGFYKVIYLSDTGYALASYLGKEPKGSAPVVQNSATYTYMPNTTMFVYNCNEFITLRNSPSTSAGEICKIPLGEPVTYLEDASNGFFKITYLGKTGYALASYLYPEFYY